MSVDEEDKATRINRIIGDAKSLLHAINPDIAAAMILADAIELVSTRIEAALGGIEDRLAEIRDRMNP